MPPEPRAQTFLKYSLVHAGKPELPLRRRIRGAQLGRDPKTYPDKENEDGQELSRGKEPDIAILRRAEKFADAPQDGITDEECARDDAVRRAHARTQEPEQRKEKQSFEQALVNLRRMTRSQECSQRFAPVRRTGDGINELVETGGLRFFITDSRDRFVDRL